MLDCRCFYTEPRAALSRGIVSFITSTINRGGAGGERAQTHTQEGAPRRKKGKDVPMKKKHRLD